MVDTSLAQMLVHGKERNLTAMSGLSSLRTHLGERAEPILVYSLALMPSVLICSVIAAHWNLFSWLGWTGRIFPWWTDGGNWLKHANAILGEILGQEEKIIPMWEEGTLQYPPLFFIILAAVIRLMEVTNPPSNLVLSIKWVALGCFFLFPLTMFFLSKRVFESSFAGIVASWLAAFHPLFLEFMGWGGYPNILGFGSLSAAFYFIVRYIEGKSPRDGVSATLLIGVVIRAHHLTSLVLLGTLALWTVFSIGFKGAERKCLVVLFSTALSAFLVYRLVFAWPPDYVFFNEAAYHRLRAGIDPYWIFKSPVLFVLFSVAFIFSIPILTKSVKAADFRLRFFAAWILTPLIGTQGYLLGVALDYNRVFFFLFQPLILLVSASVLPISLRELTKFLRENVRSPRAFLKSIGRKRFVQLTSLIAVVLLVASSIISGVTTMRNINAWYNYVDPYEDQEKYRAVIWLKNNSEIDSVIVADEPIGRWIEGVSQRKVLLHTEPRFLFMKGELEREYAARALLISQYGIRSQDVWIFEQAPYGCLSPMIAFYHLGDYVNTVFLSADYSSISLNKNGNTEALNFTGFMSQVNVSRSSDEPPLLVVRETGTVRMEEKIVLNSDQSVTFDFDIETLESEATIASTSLTFPFASDVGILVNNLSRSSLRILSVPTSIGEIIFESDRDFEEIYEEPLHDTKWITLGFGNETRLRLTVKLKGIERKSENVLIYTWDEMARENSVEYLVLPGNRWEFLHLLNSPFLEPQVLDEEGGNEKLIILKFVGEEQT